MSTVKGIPVAPAREAVSAAGSDLGCWREQHAGSGVRSEDARNGTEEKGSVGSPPQLTAPRGSISLDALYRTVFEQSLDAPFREQVDLCTVLGELRRLRDVEALGSDFGHSRWTHGPVDERERADVEALVPALVKRARDLGIEVDEQEA